jgi:ribonuclease J
VHPDDRSQGEPLAGLARMANGDHRQVQIQDGDTIILSATPIPATKTPCTGS